MRCGKLTVVGCLAFAMLVIGVGPAPIAYAATERVSVDSAGGQADYRSFAHSAVSADGRFVAFESDARNLVPGDTNDRLDVFVRDRRTGQTERVSVDSAGGQIGGFLPSISADGRFVVFGSGSDAGLLMRDRLADTTEPVGRGIDGRPLSGSPSDISSDGRFVAFSSHGSTNVPGDTNGHGDVFVHDRISGETERVSVDPAGGEGNGDSYGAAISDDGRYVAFDSVAWNLVAGDTNDSNDVFVRDRLLGTTERVSVGAAGEQGNTYSRGADLSVDGRYVTFDSFATNLVPGDTNNDHDVFVRDRETDTTERVSVTSTEEQANNDSEQPAISADGRYVAFESVATNISSAYSGIFRRDRVLGKTQLVSRDSQGAVARGHSYDAAIGADGQAVAFTSDATNLVPDDTNGYTDAFVTGPAFPVPSPPTCEGQAATIVGSGGADTLTGTSGRDVIVGLGGADAITAGQGDDLVCGDDGSTESSQEGADVLTGGAGDDILSGGGQADRLWGTRGADRLDGGWGTDLLGGGSEDDALAGGSGDDTLDGNLGADVLAGGDGRDLAEYSTRAAPVSVTIGDGPGDGEAGEADYVAGDVERVRGGQAGDRLAGDAGPNWLYGGAGDDELIGGAGADVLSGEAGADRIDSRDAVRDSVYCGSELDAVLADPLDAVSASCEHRTG
jgi:Ca2+-binding RTX toxin-like protein